MAKYYVNNRLNPIVYNLERCKLTKGDLCKAMGITRKTLEVYLNDYSLINIRDLLIMSGLFGLPVEELVYILVRNKPQLNKPGKWYLEEIRKKGE